MEYTFTAVESDTEWEDFLLKHSPQSLFQSWSWGEVEKKAGHSVERFGLYARASLVAIAQISVVRAKRGTYLHLRQGPVVLRQDPAIWDALLRGILSRANTAGAWFVRISPRIDDTPDNEALLQKLRFHPSPIHEVDAERCWILDIDKSDEDLLMGMRKSTRYEIRRSEKMNITIRQSTDPTDLTEFYALYEATSKRHGFVSHVSITEEFEIFAAKKQAVLYYGYFEKKLIASALILFYGGQAIYHHGASISSKAPVSYALQWHAIGEAKKRGLSVYNFYGIAPENKPDHPWNGLTLFKKGFGGREVRYIHSKDLSLSPMYFIPHSIEKIRTKLRGY